MGALRSLPFRCPRPRRNKRAIDVLKWNATAVACDSLQALPREQKSQHGA